MDLRVSFLFSLYLIGRKVRGHFKKKNEDSMLQASTLFLLHENDLTVTDLSRLLSSKLSAISEKVIEMEQAGFVRKIKKDDGRESVIQITKNGMNQMRILIAIMKEHCTVMTNGLSNSDIEKVIPVLNRMTH